MRSESGILIDADSGMYFDAVVVYVTKFAPLFKLTLAILWARSVSIITVREHRSYSLIRVVAITLVLDHKNKINKPLHTAK